jgi:DNA-binding YbaB/EbfC family protein
VQFGGGGGMNINKLMKQAQKMQEKMLQQQGELEKKTYEGVAGGVVKVIVNGKFEPVDISIGKDAVDPDDVETLEELVLMALQSAVEQARTEQEELMKGMTAGMGMPGLPF